MNLTWKFWIKLNWWKNPLSPSGLLAPGPTSLSAHPAHLAGLNPLARVWVGQTDPAQPSLGHLLLSSIPPGDWIAAAAA
jgi:hypothetical protein